MGKKGSWFSAIKRVFTHGSKDKQGAIDGLDTKHGREKRSGKGILRRGETKSFIPLFREPSSIEKILGEADQLLIKAPTTSEPPKVPQGRPISPHISPPQQALSPQAASPRPRSPKAPRAISPRVGSPKVASPKVLSPKVASPRAASPKASTSAAASSKPAPPPKVTKGKKGINYAKRPEPTLREQQLSAIKIQAAFRGYVARRSFRAVRGLVRLQGVVKGQNVKRQTMNAMKQMQLLVRVQTQIQSRRIQLLENQARANRNDKEAESIISKWTLNQLSEAGLNGDWDDSILTKEEVDERMRKKVEAVIKRERAMAYAYSNQLWKANPTSSQTPVDIRANGHPWWWNWLDRQLPQQEGSTRAQSAAKNIPLTPPRSVSGYKPSPLSHAVNYGRPGNFTPDNHEPATPQSTRSAIPSRAKQFHTPIRTPPANTSSFNRYPKPRSIAPHSNNTPLKDDDSLVSCPPFSVGPSYMAPTVSAKAKARANSNPRDRFPGTPGSESKRRFSFPLTPNIGPFKWNKGSNKDSGAATPMAMDKRSVGDMSMDSTVSMPAALVGRKPFNRFV